MKPNYHQIQYHNNKSGLCTNINCNAECTWRGKYKNGIKNFRSLCARCYMAGRKYKLKGTIVTYAPGVKPIKTGRCSNTEGFVWGRDGKIFIECATNHDKVFPGTSVTDMDHINGNRRDNRPENLQELCKPCHAAKTKIQNDTGKKIDFNENINGDWQSWINTDMFEMQQ